jgi:aspartyl-tRNA(Asn)/glutamyl-tRNA(Gln) amidotransferase subunit C
MAITRSELERIAELARLAVPSADAERLTRELGAVLEFVETLRALDLSDCEPLAFAPAGAAARPDVPDGRTLERDRVLAAAPAHDGAFFLVPPVVEYLEP